MRIWTSRWFTKLPPAMQKFGISRSVRRGYPAGYRRVRELELGPWCRSVTPEEYHHRFMAQLGALDARAIVARLEQLGDGRDVVLLCYEAPHKPEAWCHRAQVSAWLYDELGIEVHEWGHEAAGCGVNHPKFAAVIHPADRH
ncbi:MAG TPA: hypothetical protein VMO81_03005 [Aestuariivirgaceae bacterium]|nr:hypothetical protein [Aestuariivirgaceae bacterium]